jgi:sugar-phosphatase
VTHTLEARALLFDMDGTLVDSHIVVERIWATFAGMFDLDLAEILSTSHGVRMVETIRRHAPQGTDAEELTAHLGVIELADTEGIVPIPGAPAFLAGLPAASVALVTSATLPLALSRMSAIGVPMPGAVVTAEDVAHGKPRPDCYLRAAALLGVDPADAIVFEDAEAGILAGLAAGMRVVVVGDWQSETTAGLPRIADYSAVSATVDRGVATISLGE